MSAKSHTSKPGKTTSRSQPSSLPSVSSEQEAAANGLQRMRGSPLAGLGAGDLLPLQRAIGNQAMQHLIQQKRQEGSGPALQRLYVPPTEQGVTVGKLNTMKKGWYDAAVTLLQKKMQIHNTPKTRTLLNYLQFHQLVTDIGTADNTPILDSGAMEAGFPVGLPAELYTRIADAVGEEAEAVKIELKDAYIRTLNNTQDWTTIQKEIDFGTAMQPETFTSTITPVNAGFHETYGARGKNYGLTGLGSMAPRLTAGSRDQKKENERTTNLAYTEYKEGRADGNGKVLFAAFRSGALSGKGLKDEATNWAATLANTKELLQAMVIKHVQQAAPADQLALLGGHRIAEIPVLSTSLQSGGLGGEAGMIQEQIRALQHFDHKSNPGNHVIDLMWQEPTGQIVKRHVVAKFDIIAMSFGVNAQGWSGSQKGNKAALKRLGGDVTAYLNMSRQALAIRELDRDLLQAAGKQKARNNIQSTEAEQARLGDLLHEISEIKSKNQKIEQLWAKIQGKKGDTGSYKMSSRIANLAFLMERMVHFNCKSGKDRTGVQDAEAKYLAHRMHKASDARQAQVVPDHTLKTQPENDDYQKMLFESGSLEMQKYNTGGQGYKIAPAAKHIGIGKAIPMISQDLDLEERVGGTQVLKQLQGLKRYTDIDKI